MCVIEEDLRAIRVQRFRCKRVLDAYLARKCIERRSDALHRNASVSDCGENHAFS